MGYQVILSRRARSDLHGIEAYVGRDNPTAAKRLIQALIDDAFTLAEFPHRGHRLRRRGQAYRLVHGDYLVVYRIKESQKLVEVVRFWHGARGTPPG